MDSLMFLEGLQEGNSWWTLCILASFASILIYSLFYSVGHAFNLENFKRSSKAEILQGLATLFMVLFLIFMLVEVEKFAISTFIGSNSYVVCGGSSYGFTTTAGEDPLTHVVEDGEDIGTGFYFEGLMDVVKCRFEERAKELAVIQDDLYGLNLIVFQLLSIYMSFSGIPIFQGNWIGPLFKLAEEYRLLNSFLTVVLVGANSLLSLVNYIKLNMLTVFLPFGLFLRSFKYTRGVGALFMSLAIGLYFIFPVLFVMTDPGFVEIPDLPEDDPIDPETDFCLPTFSGTVSQASTSISAMHGAEDSAALADSQKAIAQFYVYMTTHAFVVFSITLVFVRYMMFILGGEAYDLMRFVAKVI